jgi:hypothetical protein
VEIVAANVAEAGEARRACDAGFVQMVFEAVGHPRMRAAPRWGIALAALFNPTLRAVKEQLFQTERPWVVDSSKFERAFGGRLGRCPMRSARRSRVPESSHALTGRRSEQMRREGLRLALDSASEVPHATCDLGAILTAHGLIHLIAFVMPWKIATLERSRTELTTSPTFEIIDAGARPWLPDYLCLMYPSHQQISSRSSPLPSGAMRPAR